MDELDLNIDNYDLDDILELFQLNHDFTKSHLKKAYRMTLMTHPDKSGLNKEVFLFFSKAFKILKQVFDYKERAQSQNSSSCSYKSKTDYSTVMEQFHNTTNDDNDTKQKKELVNTIMKTKDFNKWFNKTFDSVKIHDEEHDNGYEKWLRSGENMETEQASNVTQMNDLFSKRKHEARSQALTVHRDLETIESSNSVANSNLVREAPQNYGSSIFSKLQYEDLRKAHTETVVPVTEEDFHNRKHFSNVNELNVYRRQTGNLLGEDETQDLYRKQQQEMLEKNNYRAYKFAKQQEQIQDAHTKWWGSLLQLKNNT